MSSISFIYPADDLSESVNFFVSRGGFTQMFADGNKFALLGSGDSRVMVLAGSERIVGSPSLAIEVSDAEGLALIKDFADAKVIDGEHERNIIVNDPAGNTVVFFVRTPKKNG